MVFDITVDKTIKNNKFYLYYYNYVQNLKYKHCSYIFTSIFSFSFQKLLWDYCRIKYLKRKA